MARPTSSGPTSSFSSSPRRRVCGIPRSTRPWLWSTPGSRPTAGRRRRSQSRSAHAVAAGSGDLDIFPEAEAALDLRHFRAGCLVGPRGALVPLALDHDIVELHAVRTLEVLRRLLGLLQPVHAHGLTRKIMITVAGHDIVALGDDPPVNACLHDRLLERDPEKPMRLFRKGSCPVE